MRECQGGTEEGAKEGGGWTSFSRARSSLSGVASAGIREEIRRISTRMVLPVLNAGDAEWSHWRMKGDVWFDSFVSPCHFSQAMCPRHRPWVGQHLNTNDRLKADPCIWICD